MLQNTSKQGSNFLEVLPTKLDFISQIIKLNELINSHNVTSWSAFLPSPAWLFVDIMYSLQKDRIESHKPAWQRNSKCIPLVHTTQQARHASTALTTTTDLKSMHASEEVKQRWVAANMHIQANTLG